MALQHRIRFAALAALAAASLGCGDPNKPPIGTVEGRVTLDGRPLAEASLTFVIKGHRPSIAFTDAEGRYRLEYNRDTTGAVVGTHAVKIKRLPSSSNPGGSRQLPEVYHRRTTLTAEVKSGRNEINFDLSSDPAGVAEGSQNRSSAITRSQQTTNVS